MRAKVTQAFKGKDNASPRCLQYELDQVIESPIADTAVENGWADEIAEKPAKAAPANKAAKAAPENK